MRKRIYLFILIPLILCLLLLGFKSGKTVTSGKRINVSKPSHPVPMKPVIQSPQITFSPDFGKIPLYFISNQGQMDKHALYYARTQRYTLWLTSEGLVFDFIKKESTSKNNDKQKNNKMTQLPGKFDDQSNIKYQREVSRLIFQNANPHPVVTPIDGTDYKVNYFIGNNKKKWKMDIPTSKAILYQEIYNRIDLKIYGMEREVEYDWKVKPGGRVSDICFKYQDVKSVTIDGSGHLVIDTRMGQLVHKKPVGFQVIDGKLIDIPVAFKQIDPFTYGFQAGSYNTNYELIIDPLVLVYSTYLGGSNVDNVYSIAVDNSGCAYVAGYTGSINFPLRNPIKNTLEVNYLDGFITKFSSTGNSLIYSTYIGSSNIDYCYGVAVDSNNCAYVVGYTRGSDFPTQNPYQVTFGGNIDAFITKLSSTGNSLIYSTFIGRSDNEYACAVTVDNSGAAYVVGAAALNFPITSSAFDTTYNGGGRDLFVLKMLPSGTDIIYSTYLGGSKTEDVTDLVVDDSGVLYIVGNLDSIDFPTQNAYKGYISGIWDAFITKVNASGSGLEYSTYFGGTNTDQIHSVAIDSSKSIYITGYSNSSNFPIVNAYRDWMAGINDAFVTKFSPSGSTLEYSTFFGGSGSESGYGIAVDSNGCAIVLGNTNSVDLPYYPFDSPYQRYNAGDTDFFLAKFFPDGSQLLFSTYFGGSLNDAAADIAIDSNNGIYITATTISTDFPVLNPYQSTFQGSISDTVVAKFTFSDPPPSIQVTAPNGGEAWYMGETHSITWTHAGISDAQTVHIVLLQNDTIVGTIAEDIPITNHTYSWTVGQYNGGTASAASNYKIRVETMDYLYQDISNANFTILNPTLTLTAPNGGQVLNVGSTYNITWTSRGDVSNVWLQYSTDNGISWKNITTSTANDGSYTWTVPNDPSSQCLVRITDIMGFPSDVSDATFTIWLQPAITVTSPNGSEEMYGGETTDITWTTVGVVGDVKIDYSTNNGTSWSSITSSTPNDGSYTWTIPYTPSTTCLVRVSETDGSPSDVSNNVFIITVRPTITVTSPNGGETWMVGTSYNITWTTTGTVGNVKIQYSTNNGTSWSWITTTTANDGSHPWTVPDTASTTCLIRVSETDDIPFDVSDATFSIAQPSSITLTSPNGGELWESGTYHDITWTTTGTFDNVLIQCSLDNGVSWRTIAEATANDGLYSWLLPEIVSQTCIIKVSESDGSPWDTSDGVFTITPTPTITIKTPNKPLTWTVGTTQRITWKSTGVINVVQIYYSTDNGVTWGLVANSTDNSGFYDWTIPAVLSTECRIKINQFGGSAYDISDSPFTITGELPPSITLTSPNGGETYTVGDTEEITWTSTGTVGNIMIDFSFSNGRNWKTIESSTPNDGSYLWTIPDRVSGECLIRIREGDQDGKPIDVSNSTFTIQSLEPTITVTAPVSRQIVTGESVFDITWTSSIGILAVKIEYSTDGGYTWISLRDSYQNSGVFEWTVPGNVSSDTCFIRITDTASGAWDMNDTDFSIHTP